MAKLMHTLRVALNLRMSNCKYLWSHYAEL
jgi:hypothetical protein